MQRCFQSNCAESLHFSAFHYYCVAFFQFNYISVIIINSLTLPTVVAHAVTFYKHKPALTAIMHTSWYNTRLGMLNWPTSI